MHNEEPGTGAEDEVQAQSQPRARKATKTQVLAQISYLSRQKRSGTAALSVDDDAQVVVENSWASLLIPAVTQL